MGRDRSRVATLSVGKIGRNAQLAFASDLHARHTLVPSFDHIAMTENELKGVPGSDRAVELLAARQPAGVVDHHLLSGDSFFASSNLDVPIFQAGGGLGGL